MSEWLKARAWKAILVIDELWGWEVSSLWGEAVNPWRLALCEADDLAVGRGDDGLALGDGRGGRYGRGGFVFPDFLAAGEIEPVDAAVVGADEYAAAGDRR